MHEYMLLGCCILCGFVFGVSLEGCFYEELTAENAAPSYLTSPGYPQYNQDPQICTWIISTSLFYYVNLEVLTLDLEESTGCVNDSLTIFESASDEIGRLCGRKNSITFSSRSYIMIIKYRTNGTVPSIFRLKYSAVSKREINLNSVEPHIVSSPNYPELYPADADEWWRIHSPIGIVKMVSLDFGLVETTGCNYDYLEAYDGNDQYSPLLGRWCGHKRVTASSTGIFMFVKFQSIAGRGGGFRLSFTASEAPNAKPDSEAFASTAAVVGGILGCIVLVAVVGCLVCLVKRRSNPITRTGQNQNASSNSTHLSVLRTQNTTLVSPPEYSEVVKDGPPSYFEVTQRDSRHSLTNTDVQGEEHPAV